MSNFAYQQYQMARLAEENTRKFKELFTEKKICVCCETAPADHNELCLDCIREMCENTGVLPPSAFICGTCGRPLEDNGIAGCVDCLEEE